MKKTFSKFFITILALLFVLPSFSVLGDPAAEESNLNSSSKYLLTVDEVTGDFSVTDTETGRVFDSYPREISDDPDAGNEFKNEVKSQISLVYYDKKDRELKLFSYEDAVLKEEAVSVTETENGYKILYALGEKPTESILPNMIYKERMDFVLNHTESERNKRRIQTMYAYYNLADAPDDETAQIWLSQYPMIKDKPVYVFRQGSDKEIRDLTELFLEAGYTKEMYTEDSKISSTVVEDKEALPYFEIPLYLTVQKNGLCVSINADEIKYDDKSFNLNTINILPYFASAKSEDGFILIPDGSGTLLDFKSRRNTITKKMYENNPALLHENALSEEKPSRLPYFAMNSEGRALLGDITEGAENTEITAKNGANNSGYHTVYPVFIYKNKNTMSVVDVGNSGSFWNVFEKNGYKGEFKINYTFLKTEENALGELADAYRKSLEERGILKEKIKDTDIPFYIDTYGIISVSDRFLGFPITKKVPLTTYKNARIMIDEFSNLGVENISLRYFGYANGGMNSTVPSKISLEGKLGSKKELELLLKSEADIYFDADFVKVKENRLFDDFTKSDAVQNLEKKLAGFIKTSLATGIKDKSTYQYVINPKSAEKYAGKYLKKADKLAFDGISLASIGQLTPSDFNEKSYINRKSTAEAYKRILEKYSKGHKLITDGGNAYVLPYVSSILNMPLEGSKYASKSESVPFMQMVLRGYVSYAGKPLNLGGNPQNDILDAVRTGSGIYYLLNYENTIYLKDTDFSDCYASSFDDFKKEAAELYTRYSDIMKNDISSAITDYKTVQENVYLTVFENGTKLYTNYNSYDVAINGFTIKAMDFAALQ